ncbi:MAG: hypothetical protein WAL90_07845 [Desulfobacterales bacterium]
MVILIFWFAILLGVTKLFQAVTLGPFNSYHGHPSVMMILVGCLFLLSAMAVKKISQFFSRSRSNRKQADKILTVNTRTA